MKDYTLAFNINYNVVFRLTPQGRQYWYEHWLTGENCPHRKLSEHTFVQHLSRFKTDIPVATHAENWYEMPMWEMIHLFGPGLFQGNDLIETEIALSNEGLRISQK